MTLRSTLTRLGLLITVALLATITTTAADQIQAKAATHTGKVGTNAICRTCDTDPPDGPPDLPPPPPPPPPYPSLATLMNRYTAFDINGDGRFEINSLKPLFPNPEPYSTEPKGLVIVLVDPKIVTDDPSIQMSRVEMSLWLGLLGSDIFRDGFFPYFVEASVYDGAVHQDGRTVLALRRFLKDVHQYYPLSGVLLVGSFPDASLVRQVFEKEKAADPIPMNTGAVPGTHVGDHLVLWSELITPRAEIVLGDLDGNWEALYREAEFTVTNYRALPQEPTSSYPAAGQILETPRFQATPVMFRDVFFVQDHQVGTWTDSGWLRLTIASLDEPSPEATAADRQLPNRIARPEIVVSRIDPKRVAIMPTAPRDLDGRSPLDAAGKPQKLRYNYRAEITWQRDRSLERRLIADYIARSHTFRLGYDNSQPFRTSAVRSLDTGLKSPSEFNGLLRRAADFSSSSVVTDTATLLDYIAWLKRPAVLRGIAAHSDAVNSQFGAVTSSWGLEAAAGGIDAAGQSRVWRWVPRQQGADWFLEPTFSGLTVDANFHIYRTMWENKVLEGTGQAFYVHDGCEVMRPSNHDIVPYNSPYYGQFNTRGAVANGESLMFYTNGLGLMARNKVFNDTPAGFYEAIKSSGHFGAGWKAYFQTDAASSGLNERTIDPIGNAPERRTRSLQRKRSYMWNTIGDPTLKLRY